MKTSIGVSLLLLTLGFAILVQAQVTNTPDSQPVTNTVPADKLPALIPAVKFEDVPITSVIENLARIAEINYMIDPYRCQKLIGSADGHIPEPTISCHLTNVAARDLLERILNVRNFVLIDDPVTHVARITRKDEPEPSVDASLLDQNTNSPAMNTNSSAVDAKVYIPQYHFSDVPLDLGLDNLIRLSAENIGIDSRITGRGGPPDSPFVPMPVVSLNWKNITVKQAIVALCQCYHLIIVKDDTTGVLKITPDDGKPLHHRRHF